MAVYDPYLPDDNPELALQLEFLERNYVNDAIDLVTYLGAVEDVCAGVPNSYAEALYNPGDGL